MAIEDGAVLARAFQQQNDTAQALQLYQRNRLQRTTRVVNESSANRARMRSAASAVDCALS